LPTTRDAWQGAPPPAAEEEEPEMDLEVSASQLKEWVEAGKDVLLVDIREPYEVAQGFVSGALLLPMNSVPGRLDALPQDKVIVLYCAAGVRSFGVAHYLREQGYPEAWSLVGGIGAWLETGAAWERPSRPGPG
jgi:adenylyltransferase/sulfurtransferase